EPAGRWLEQVEAAGAGRRRGAETAELGVAGRAEALTEVRRRDHRAQAAQRIDAGLLCGGDRGTVVDRRIPGPVGAGDTSFETGDDVVGQHVREGLAVV